jgi:hypothetical protein
MSNSPKQKSISPPVRPAPELLPLGTHDFTWARFQTFCLDFVAKLPGAKKYSHYGKAGNRQRGIDLKVDFENGEKWVFQCKQWKEFSGRDAEKAINATIYAADRYILFVSCEVGTDVRDVCDQHPGWEAWDAQDISQKVREMDPEAARRLVERHFGPLWRKEFLGLGGLSAFVTPEEFFRRHLHRDHLFNHMWKLVGRGDLLKGLHAFVKSKRRRVAVISGRGGVGKSKATHAFASAFEKRHAGLALRFVAEGVTISVAALDELPAMPCVVVVDDAHKCEELNLLLAAAQQRPYLTKIILLSRPYGIQQLDADIMHAGFDVTEVTRFPELDAPNHGELTKLAAQALGRRHAHLADRLAADTKDCPLITVVGGRLLAQEKITPDLFVTSESFRRTVLTRFRDAIVGEISTRLDRESCVKLIRLLAALVPIRDGDDSLLKGMAEFLGLDRAELITALGELEGAGVLLRRGHQMRLIPDVLADEVLHEACLSRGRPTGYAEKVFEKFKALGSNRVFRNLAELDWRVRATEDAGTALLDSLWRKIWEDFRSAPHSTRRSILEALQEVAYTQPRRVLELAEHAMRNPATTPESEEELRYHRPSHKDILKALPLILEGVAYTPEYLSRCCDLLWELSRDDEPHGPSKGALRVLQDLARYTTYPRNGAQQAVLDSVERWLRAPDAHARVGQALDVVDPVLRKTDHVDYSRGPRLVSELLTVVRAGSMELRERALGIIARCTAGDDIRVVLRALHSLKLALSDPAPIFEQKISEEDFLQWVPEQIQILDMIEGVRSRNSDPFVILGVADAVGWHARYGRPDEVKTKARRIVAALIDTYEVRLIQALTYEFDLVHLRADLEFNDGEEDYDDKGQLVAEMCDALADEFVGRNASANVGLRELNLWMRNIAETGWGDGRVTLHNGFLMVIARHHPDYASRMCEALAESPDCGMASRSGDLLMVLRGAMPEPAITIARRFLSSGDQSLCYAVAESYKSGTWLPTVQAEDLNILRELFSDTRPTIKKVALKLLPLIHKSSPEMAIDLAVAADTGNGGELAKELCRAFDADHGINPDLLTDDELRSLLSKLVPVNEISRNYHINKFLTYASDRLPRDVFNVLLRRVEQGTTKDFYYAALPGSNERSKFSGLAAHGDYPQRLREVRDAMLGWRERYNSRLPNLFKEISLGFNEESLGVLSEWVDSGNPEKLEAAILLLSGARPQFAFENEDFVINILRRAYAVGDECYQIAKGVMWDTAVPTHVHRMYGEPPQSMVFLRDRASAVMSRLDAGTPEHRFFESLVEYANENIMEERKKDDEQMDY